MWWKHNLSPLSSVSFSLMHNHKNSLLKYKRIIGSTTSQFSWVKQELPSLPSDRKAVVSQWGTDLYQLLLFMGKINPECICRQVKNPSPFLASRYPLTASTWENRQCKSDIYYLIHLRAQGTHTKERAEKQCRKQLFLQGVPQEPLADSKQITPCSASF